MPLSTTPLPQWGFQQCLPFSWTTLRDKHCRHPIAAIGVVDTFWQRLFGIDAFMANGNSNVIHLKLPNCSKFMPVRYACRYPRSQTGLLQSWLHLAPT